MYSFALSLTHSEYRVRRIIVTVICAAALIAVIMLAETYMPFGFTDDYASGAVISEKAAVNPVFADYFPTVNVKFTGARNRTVNIEPCSVENALAEIGVYLDDNDSTDVPLDEIVADGMTVEISKIDEIMIVSTKVIPFETLTTGIQTIPRGVTEIITEGQDGETIRTLRQTYVNGNLEDESVVSEAVTKTPVTSVVNTGIGGSYTNADGERFRYSYYVDVIATAYSGEQFGGHTFTGKQVEVGMIAVDPDVIPLGSECYVVGDAGDFGVMAAEDTGSKIIGKTIDIFMELTDEAIAFGRKAMRVYVLE